MVPFSIPVSLGAAAIPAVKAGLALLSQHLPEISTVAGTLLADKMPPVIGKVIGFGAKIAGEAVNEFGAGSEKTRTIVNTVVDAIKPAAEQIAKHTDKAPPEIPDLSPGVGASIDSMLQAAEAARRAAGSRLEQAMKNAEETGGAIPQQGTPPTSKDDGDPNV